jgi:hypothetical protein
MFLAGCGSQSLPPNPTVYPVKGKVVLSDGQPLSYGRVYLSPRDPKGTACNGFLNADGTFDKLMAYPGGFGAAPGKYLLSIEPTNKNDKGFYAGKAKDMPTPPEKYQDPKTSELVFDIKAGDNDLGTITLK